MKKLTVVILVLVSAFGALACQAAEDEVVRQRQRVEERVDKEINERSTRIENRVEEEVTRRLEGE